MSWRQLDEEYVIRNEWLSVRKDHVVLPTGIEIEDFYVIERPKHVHVIAITTDGKFVFERQYRYAIDRACLEICAGKIEPDENPLEVAKRELLEETGYSGGEWILMNELAVDSSNMTEISYSFLANYVERVSD